MRLAAAFAVLCLLGRAEAPAGPALDSLDLYTARTVVSGTAEPNRKAGVAACLLDVLVKVSGDPSLADEPRLPTLAKEAEGRVLRLRYRDRLEGRPVHDDQGTYDRPHDLTVSFAPDAILRDLAALGRKPWLDRRPTILVLLDVAGRRRSFRLTAGTQGDDSAGMRAALAAAGELFGLEVSLVDAAAAARGVAAPGPMPTVLLSGTLVWSDAALGWVVEWRLQTSVHEHRWGASGISFDEAFRVGMRGSAQLLSGSGAPP